MTTELLAPIPSGIDPDAWLSACARVRKLCGWHVAPTITETITVYGTGGEVLIVPHTLHLINVVDVTDNGTAVPASQWQDYGVVYHPSGDWGRRTKVQLTITHGYPQCPEDLLGAVRELATTVVPAGIPRGRVSAGPFSADYSDPGLSQSAREAVEAHAIAPEP